MPSVLTDTIDFCHFKTSVFLLWGSEGQQKAKPVRFIFSHTFELYGMKVGMAMKLNRLVLLFVRFTYQEI